jgi:ubiquinone/menaquinone biosynthesis C-methylase UbiE
MGAVAWFETFFDELYGRVLAQSFDARTCRLHARTIERMLGLKRGQSVLDVPCGQGRIAILLAKKGLDVTGVDQSAGYLRDARLAAKKAHVDVRFVRADMRQIDFCAEFDAAFNWFGSFGYFSDRDNVRHARRVLRALKPGGRFLVEGFDRPGLLRDHKEHAEVTIGGVTIENRWSFEPRTRRLRDRWTLSGRGRVETRRISVRLYSVAEIRALLRAAGFARVEVRRFDSLRSLRPGSRLFIAVAEKSGRPA